MIAPIVDCSCLVAGGMGRGAYERITSAGIRAIVTDLREPDEAAIACAEGRIETWWIACTEAHAVANAARARQRGHQSRS